MRNRINPKQILETTEKRFTSDGELNQFMYFAGDWLIGGTYRVGHIVRCGGELWIATDYDGEIAAPVSPLDNTPQWIQISSGTSGDTSLLTNSQTANTFLASPDTTNGVPGFRAIVQNDLPALAFTKITDVLPSRLIGRHSGSTGAAEMIAIGSGLSLSGGTLSATGGAETNAETVHSAGGLAAIDFSTGGIQTLSVSTSTAAITVANCTAGKAHTIIVNNTYSGATTISFPSGSNAPAATLSIPQSKKCICMVLYDGTSYYWSFGSFMAVI